MLLNHYIFRTSIYIFFSNTNQLSSRSITRMCTSRKACVCACTCWFIRYGNFHPYNTMCHTRSCLELKIITTFWHLHASFSITTNTLETCHIPASTILYQKKMEGQKDTNKTSHVTCQTYTKPTMMTCLCGQVALIFPKRGG
jgi:hypothetical protein